MTSTIVNLLILVPMVLYGLYKIVDLSNGGRTDRSGDK